MSTHEAGIDLRHLKIFLEIYKHCSVSRAAEALDMTQSSVSIALARLRLNFDDPLFVRSGQTMQPTARSTMMAQPLADAMQLIERAASDVPEFEPATAVRVFRVALADVGRLVVLPILARFLRERAPNVVLEVHDIGPTTPDQLEAGAIDLAFGFMDTRKSGLFSQSLFADHFVCIVRKGHPTISSELTLTQFKAADFVIVDSKGNSVNLCRKALEVANIRLKVSTILPTYLGIAEVVNGTDLLAVVPHRLALTLSENYKLNAVALPIKMPVYAVHQHWHRRFQHERGPQWLRQSIHELFSTR